MVKSELVRLVAGRNPQLYLRDVKKVVNAIFDEMVEALAEGGRVELRGFGGFTVRHRAAKAGKNPRTGEPVNVGERWAPRFSPGKRLRERLKKTD